jgi:hypothetical protein
VYTAALLAAVAAADDEGRVKRDGSSWLFRKTARS